MGIIRKILSLAVGGAGIIYCAQKSSFIKTNEVMQNDLQNQIVSLRARVRILEEALKTQVSYSDNT